MRVKISSLAIVLICGAFYACSSPKSAYSGSSGSEDDNSPVIAEVNGEAAHKAAFDRFLKSRLSDFTDQNEQGQEESDKQRSQLLDEFIQRQLIIQEARKNNIEPSDDEIRSALEEQHRQANVQGADQNQATLESDERRVEIYNDLRMLKYQTETLKLKEARVTPQEVEEYYKQNVDRYQ